MSKLRLTFSSSRANSLRSALLLGGMLLISACGWHLKGDFDNTDQLGTVYIGGDIINGVLNRTVRAEIRAKGSDISDLQADADYVVWIGALETRVRPASYDALVRTVENEIIMYATFEVRSAEGQLILGPERVFAERVYEYDVQGVTSSAAQFTIIERELQERLGHQIARRLAAIDPTEKEIEESMTGAVQTHQH